MAQTGASLNAEAEDALLGRPTLADLQGENHYAQLARKTWSQKKKPPKVQPKVIKEELWDYLEQDGFAFGKLLLLEQLQLLEGYLWPAFSEDSSNYHVLLIALILNVKRRENLPSWDLLANKPEGISTLFHRILSMTVDLSLSLPIRTQLIVFVMGAFQSLDNGLVRKECAPLVSIAIWHNLHSTVAREQKLEQNPTLKRLWRGAAKRYDAADEPTKTRLRFERTWLYTLILEFLDKIFEDQKLTSHDHILYCERFLELLTDLQSQLPTRRYVNSLIQDLNLLTVIKTSPLRRQEDSGLFRDLVNLLDHYTFFPIDDQSGQQFSTVEYHQNHDNTLSYLQRIIIKGYQSKLKILALSNLGSMGNNEETFSDLESLPDEDLKQLCTQFRLRSTYPSSSLIPQDRKLVLSILLASLERHSHFQEKIKEMPILPTEAMLYEDPFVRDTEYNGSRPLAIPKLNLYYLSMGDFLWRSFILHRSESFYEIRNHIEDTVKRMQPRSAGVNIRFEGFSRLALPIAKPAILDVAPAKVGDTRPAIVRAEVILDVQGLNFGVRREWETLRPDDVVFLVGVDVPNDPSANSNGYGHKVASRKLGIKYIRCAEVLQLQDDKGRPLREQQMQAADGYERRVRQRKIILKLDASAYSEDTKRSASGGSDVYESINLLVRRRARENNFKPILESMSRLTLSDIPAPSWLKEVFLGYGDPASATYKRLPNRLKSIDYRDTFLDWAHLIESLPGKTIEPSEEAKSSFGPPYVLETVGEETQKEAPPPSKKRRRDQEDVPKPMVTEIVQVSSYKPPNTGPYPTDAPRLNTVQFTPAQIEAISSGTQPGLTVIIGPPGTGKTDVATQIINNVYHNFPTQRTLLVAHSNQALNQLFQKIVALDIDERHLLRLGHGEEELETEASYSKHGRVESFLEIGARYLAEVNRLARSINAPGAHGNSCETADYFNLVYIKPLWKQYWDVIATGTQDAQEIITAFPFHDYFSNLPTPLFPENPSREQVVDIVSGCYRHIEKIFSELEDIRPFEILRNSRDRANYLLIKEARIIAMTSTHAAMQRQEIANLGFHYDNVIMEEAAQITEIENFVPLALQNPREMKNRHAGKEKDMPLQRVVLVGDHLQNSPIIQNAAFSQYANLEQSLFLRLVRLGVPTIMLDAQGRARPSLAELYKWRYPSLQNLPSVLSQPEFQAANAGLLYEYQFIDVPDYKDKGETQPSPHFIQNLGEAEYAVALFMYMRLLGYPASKISILAAYAGQRALIRDVLTHRCKENRLFGMPRTVSTVDRYQGEQNDYIILSLTRTTRPGYLRSLRRLTVALSRARLGLYILGRRAVFEAVPELHAAFNLLFQRPETLRVVTGELHPTTRMLDDDVGEGVEMTGVEHLGQYVYEMSKAKAEAIKRGEGMLPPAEKIVIGDDDDDDGVGAADEESEEEVDEPELGE